MSFHFCSVVFLSGSLPPCLDGEREGKVRECLEQMFGCHAKTLETTARLHSIFDKNKSPLLNKKKKNACLMPGQAQPVLGEVGWGVGSRLSTLANSL